MAPADDTDPATCSSVVPVHGATRELRPSKVDDLKGFFEKRGQESECESHDGSRHHHEKPVSIVTAAAAAVINYLLMFGLCCAYGMIMFADDHNKQHRALGVKMTLSSALIMGLLLSAMSRVPVAVGGTDLNPVVFLGSFVGTLSTEIAAQLDLELPQSDYRRLQGRWLGASSGPAPEFCSGEHLESHLAACQEYHEQLRATTIFTVAVSTAMLGLAYFCLGHFRLTRYVNYMPTSITEAFLSCIGYKVFKYALKFCKYDIKQFVPAACIGVPLYFVKAMHLGNPAVVMPLGLLIPLGVFHGCLYAAGSSIEQAREDDLMFPEMLNVPFYSIWSDSLGKYDSINISAWTKTLPDLCIMLIVCVLDCVLKISATEMKIPVKVHADYEIMLHGLGNVLLTACGSSVGYMQLKFNVISFGVMGNTKDRRAGAIYAGLCGICFFGTIALFNFLPRFFLGTMLFFAGSGFVAENLWGSRKYLSLVEWLEILIILGVFIITGKLLPAVVVGGLLCGISFIMKYARVPAIAGRPLTGKDVATRERPASTLLQKNLQHITQTWLMVLRLKGFVFFASAHAVAGYVRMRMDSEDRDEVPAYRRLKFVIFDCEMLDGMDASGAKSMLKLVKECVSRHVRVLWSSVTPAFIEELKIRDILHGSQDWFSDLNQAVQHVEAHVLRHRREQQETWLSLHSAFARSSELTQKQVAFEPFRHVFLADGARLGSPWRYCESLPMREYRTVLYEPGKQSGHLYLVHSGTVAIFETIPQSDKDGLAEEEEDDQWSAPHAIYRHGWFLNREALIRAPSKYYAIAVEDGEVLCWSPEQWRLMSCERPAMMLELLRAVMKQQGRDNERESQSTDRLPMDMDDQDWVDFGDEQENADGEGEGFVLRRLGSNLSGGSKRNSFRRASDCEAMTRRSTISAGRRSRSSFRASVRKVNTTGMLPSAGYVSTSNLPEEVQVRLSGLQAAQALGRLGLYEPLAPGEGQLLPELPAALRRDLEVAFRTFCSCENGTSVLQPSQAAQALLYAGAVGRGVSPPRAPLTEDAFLLLGQRALLVPLSESRRSMIRGVFAQQAKEAAGERLARGELSAALRSLLRVDVNVDEVECVSSAWLADPRGGFDVEAFTSIVSWFLRKHEQDWQLLCGFRDVMGLAPESRIAEAKLSASLLSQQARITLEEAKEMLWSADWLSNGAGEGKALDFGGFFSAVLICLDHHPGKLPPPPRSSLASPPAPQQPPPVLPTELNGRQSEICSQEIMSIGRSSVNSISLAGCSTPMTPKELPSTLRARLHLLLEEPGSSKEASVLSFFIIAMIILSVFHMVLQPLISGKEDEHSPEEQRVWFGLELFFTVIFTIELLLRFVVADALHTNTMLGFASTPRNICDFFAITPFYIEVTLGDHLKGLRLLRVIRLVRLTRLARIARLSRKIPLAAPVSMVLVVIWGIYLVNDI